MTWMICYPVWKNCLRIFPAHLPHPGLQEQYDRLLDEISRKTSQNTYTTEIVDRFGLSHLAARTPVAHLSGGQKTRLALAKVILSSPDILLLDEPTNHLDIQMLEWLESWLQQTRATVLVISHDRAFLDNVTRITFELDPVSHNVKEYAGNYSTYLDAKQREWDSQWQNYNEQQIEIQELKSAAAHLRGIAKFRKGGKADSGDKFAAGFFGNRSKGTVGRAKNIEKRLERILTDEHVAKPRPSWQVRIDFNDSAPSGRNVLVMDSLCVGYQPPSAIGGYLPDLALRSAGRPDRTQWVRENHPAAHDHRSNSSTGGDVSGRRQCEDRRDGTGPGYSHPH